MKKNILVIYSDKSLDATDRGWEPNYLKKRLTGHNIIIAKSTDIMVLLEKGVQKIYVHGKEIALDNTLEFVWFRTRGERTGEIYEMLPFSTGMAKILLDKNIKFFDTELADMLSINKFTDQIILSLKDVLIPKTLLVTDCTKLDYEFVEEYLGLPFVAKTEGFASCGQAIELVETEEELELFKSKSHTYTMLQEFIPNENEYRYLVSNFKLGRIEKRWHNDQERFRNNSALGAFEETLSIDSAPNFARIEAERMSKFFKRELCGIDFIEYKGEYYCLEANHTPGFDDPDSVDLSYYAEVPVFSANVALDDIEKQWTEK